MKYIKKTGLKNKRLLSLVLLASFTVILAVSILIPLLANNDETEQTVQDPPEVIEGEARQNGMCLAYPEITKKLSIDFVNIKNKTGEFGFVKYTQDNYHTLYYVDSNGDQQIYYPEICKEDPDFVYTSLFAIETGDGYSQFTIVDYLFQSLQAPYFNVRIPFESNPEALKTQLATFGFDGEKASEVMFTYTTETGEKGQKTVQIGGKSVTGQGYYFIVTDGETQRPYIYSSLNNYYDYAISGINALLKPLLVSDGLKEDNGFGPYLTTGYYQWKNEFHNGDCECGKYECECRDKSNDYKCSCTVTDCICEEPCRVIEITEGSKVIAYTDTIVPDLSDKGYAHTGYDLIEIDLALYAENLENLSVKDGYEAKNFERVISALKSKKIGEYSEENEIIYSLVTANKRVDFSDSETKKYTYKITAIEAIITDSGEISDIGAFAGDEHTLVKLTYTAVVDGEAQSEKPMHAVLDLSSTALSADTVEKVKNAKIGEALDIEFDVEYTVENTVKKSSKCVITEILEIGDANGQPIDKITDTSVVGYRYTVYVDGVSVGEYIDGIELSKVGDGEELKKKVKEALIGQKAGNVNIEIDEYYAYFECFLGFATYKISNIDSFVSRELVCAFAFKNSSVRDPYYGESLYENLMQDERKLYGMNSSVCENAVRILGGISIEEEASSTTAAGLSGDKVVAVGLTPEVMKEYGLYAYTVHFELPRGIIAYEPDNTNQTLGEQLDDYTHRSTLGFDIYISEVDPKTNTRYIASDLYDVVTRVPADDFVFLKYDFQTFWARRELMVVDISYIENVSVEFTMSDLKGGYNFKLTQPEAYRDALGVFATTFGDEFTSNKLVEFISDPKNINAGLITDGGVSLKTFYLNASDADEEEHKAVLPDTLGGSCFKDIVRLIFLTSYTDILSEEERKAVPDEDSLVMRMTLDLNENAPKNPYTYVYEFYRIDDRRVRVSIYQRDDKGNRVTDSVSDFYVSTFAFKKLVNNFCALLNAEVFDTDVGYPDEKR